MGRQLRLLNSQQYAFDTSAFMCIEGSYPTLWKGVIRLIHENRLKTVTFVMDEVRRLDHNVHARIQPLRDLLVYKRMDELFEEARRLVNLYPGMSRPRSQRTVADPWVIALAATEDLIVVSQEKIVNGGIPAVCQKEKIPHMAVTDLLKSEKLSIGA